MGRAGGKRGKGERGGNGKKGGPAGNAGRARAAGMANISAGRKVATLTLNTARVRRSGEDLLHASKQDTT